MNKMVKDFLGELSGVLKNNNRPTSGVCANIGYVQENLALVENPKVEQEPQGGETDDITYLREFTRLQPLMFNGTKGSRMLNADFCDQRTFRGYQNPTEDVG